MIVKPPHDLPSAEQPEVRLPFHLDVPYRSYLDYALPLSVLKAHADFQKFFFTYNIQTFFPDSILGLTPPKLNKFQLTPSLNSWQWKETGLLKIENRSEHKNNPEDPIHLVSDMRAWLSSGHYLETRLNEYYMPCRQSFGKDHYLHINLIVGFNREKRLFYVAGYDENYEYIVSLLDESDLIKAFYDLPKTSITDSDQSHCAYHRMIWRWLPQTTGNKVVDSLGIIESQMIHYMSGTSANEYEIVPTDDGPPDKGTWGIKSYDSWAKYLQKTALEGSSLDLRSTRTLWEHKTCMVLRVEYLASLGLIIPDDLVIRFKNIAAHAAKCRLLGFAYDQTRSEKPLSEIGEILPIIQELEEAAWNELLSVIKYSVRKQ